MWDSAIAEVQDASVRDVDEVMDTNEMYPSETEVEFEAEESALSPPALLNRLTAWMSWTRTVMLLEKTRSSAITERMRTMLRPMKTTAT